jgi:23S rRNA (cytosine1962-C5)-methyltransferase
VSDWPVYELLDFGEGRKLERFGAWMLDRPCPAAIGVKKQHRAAWGRVTARFDGDRAADGEWTPPPTSRVDAWEVREVELGVPLDGDARFAMRLELLPSGQVGVFPEQLPCWKWIQAQVAKATRGATPEQSAGPKVLNLFAYTGGSTLAAARAGAEVVHVDAARSVVERARQNAAASGLADHPVRWIVEDAIKFCRREVNRGNRYDAVVLDPPTYGHGPKGEEWLVKRDLLPLLELCGELTERSPKFVLLTSHTPSIGAAELSAYLSDGMFGHCGQPPRTGELALETSDGRRLPSGIYARWPA